MKRGGRVVVVAATLLGVLVLAGALSVSFTQHVPFDGTTIEGYLPDPSVPFSVWVEREQQRRGNAPIQVVAGDFSAEIPATALGIAVDVGAMLEQAHRQTRNGSLWSRSRRALAARRGVLDWAWLTRLDREAARVTLSRIARSIDRAPVDAELDLVRRRQVHAVSGSKLDIERTLDFIESHRSADLALVPLVIAEVPPQVRDGDVLGIDLDSVLSRYETSFRTRAGTRAINIRVAARALHGLVLSPGAVFSFNHVVGPRIEARGYREALVIVDDELEPGVGGGVCQVATTLHAAAVLGGLDIVERRSHSRPSGYAPLGLDATVIDGKVDLKFRNPYPAPLAILASFPDQYRLQIELVGLRPPAQFEHTTAVTKRHEFYRRVATKPEVPAGTIQRKQKGNFGFEVTSTVTATHADGTKTEQHYRSRYWPVPEVYWIGADTELAALPPLPEGATGVMLDGKVVQGTIPADVEERAAKAEPTLDAYEL
ncbi:MAG TPA: VanW family protein [Polyangiaceae bacterium]|nr:VanW family protein [Polyangiaceae bacterium]